MSIGPIDTGFEKRCFTYCGPEQCTCGIESETDFWMIVPSDPDVEYEWKGISDCLEAGLDVSTLIDEEGWVFVGGALRRPKGWTKS